MTWAEYMIRLVAWKRMEKREMMKTREIAWITYIAPHQDPKKMKKTINAFWPVDHPKISTTELMRERMKKAYEDYKNQVKAKQNG